MKPTHTKNTMRQSILQHPDPAQHIKADHVWRPRSLDGYYGQTSIKTQLKVSVQAALFRQEALDHILLSGPPGLGKTTLAQIVANELGVTLRPTSGPALEKTGDLAALLTNLQRNDCLFIDEIHRLSPAIEELLYPAMEDRVLDIILGEGPSARSLRMELTPFTLIGATTKAGLLSPPLRDRFGIRLRLEYYQIPELECILNANAKKFDLILSPPAATLLAQRARGTPRIANALLRRARDLAQIQNTHLSIELVESTLRLMGIDAEGLDPLDFKFLKHLIETFEGQAVGIETLAASLGECARTLEETVEPYLLQKGFLKRTPRGRLATFKAYQHLQLIMQKTDEEYSLLA